MIINKVEEQRPEGATFYFKQPNEDVLYNQILLPKPTVKPYFSSTSIQGIVWIELEAEEGYSSPLFEAVVDFFEFHKAEQEEVQFGFNSFRSRPENDKFIPSSLRVTMERESE
jgi:hypothetical protein